MDGKSTGIRYNVFPKDGTLAARSNAKLYVAGSVSAAVLDLTSRKIAAWKVRARGNNHSEESWVQPLSKRNLCVAVKLAPRVDYGQAVRSRIPRPPVTPISFLQQEDGGKKLCLQLPNIGLHKDESLLESVNQCWCVLRSNILSWLLPPRDTNEPLGVRKTPVVLAPQAQDDYLCLKCTKKSGGSIGGLGTANKERNSESSEDESEDEEAVL
ncbi:hypothetical protein V494_01817 [Pseudogymnoascus sp. VKM F-4513 (FW-928)]|nr:hypothetical protein V494_01817 [Pseudogymnoascus sp. VKM F-4513 (FW-928)]